MFGFGKKKKKAELWRKQKGNLIEKCLGPALDDAVLYIIPPVDFAPGLYVHLNDGYFALSTLDMSELPGKGASNNRYDNIEFCMMAKEKITLDETATPILKEGSSFMLMRYITTAIADYAASGATLNVGDTIEFPKDYDETIGGKCFFFWPHQGSSVDASLGLMMIIEIHSSEMEFARSEGPSKLVDKLKNSKAFPFSYPERLSVI